MNYDQLRLKIQNSIKGNASREITGFLLQDVLLTIVDVLGADIISGSNIAGKASDSDKLEGHPASYFATADSLNDLVAVLSDMWYIDADGDLHTEHNVVSDKEISAGGAAEEGEGGGESGETTGDYKMYHHSQGTAAKEWRVEHGLGKYPNVRIVDSNKMLCYGDVKYINDSVLTITFGAAEKGDAYCD